MKLSSSLCYIAVQLRNEILSTKMCENWDWIEVKLSCSCELKKNWNWSVSEIIVQMRSEIEERTVLA